MRSSPIFVALVLTAVACETTFAQVTYEGLSQASNGDAGDHVLNAPYRGTINSLRDATIDVPFGEVRTHVEPVNNGSIAPAPNITVWLSAEAGFEQAWDRSVLRFYRGLDASGFEIDLTDTNETNPINLGIPASAERFSFRAIGTKTLTPVKFRLKFRYALQGLSTATFTRDFTVAPMTATAAGIADEADAFQFGVSLLHVQSGAARLTIPTGRTAITAGAVLVTRGRSSSAQIPRFDVALPAAGETVVVADANQFAINQVPFNKTAYGTPFSGYLRGFLATSNPNQVRGPDGTIYEYLDDLLDWPNVFKVTRIQPLALGSTHSATQLLEWEELLLPGGSAFADAVTSIRDQASPSPNQITLARNGAGFLTGVSTSDGRSWTIESEPIYGRITGIIPAGGKGARYFKYLFSLDEPINRYRVTQVRLGPTGGDPNDPTAGQDIMYAFIFGADGQPREGDLLEERHFVDGALRPVVEHGESSPTSRLRREFTGAVPSIRRTKFTYDTAAVPPLAHRLRTVTSYSGSDGTGTAFSTQYTHDVGAPTDSPANAGTMALTRVDLPDGTFITHEYDKSLPATHNLGLLLKTTRSGVGGSPSLVTYDVDHEYFYTVGTPSVQRLFHRPRIVKQRDGRGVLSEVTFDYEDGGADQASPDGTPADGLTGEFSNQLRTQSGPLIALGTSGTRTPLERYSYNQANRMLKTVETRFGSDSGAFRRVDYEYDSLLRLRKSIIDPTGIAATTESQYVDNLATQDRITIDPNGFYTKTTFDNDGRPRFMQRFLSPGAASGNFYQTESVYDTNGRLFQLKVDNKDQTGNVIAGQTNPIVTEHTYDRLGRLTLRVLAPGLIGQEANIDYNWLGDIEREFDTSGRGVSRLFDGRGLVDSETPLAVNETPDTNLTVQLDYDANGRLEFTTSPTGAILQNVYDDFGRVTQQIRKPGSDGGVNIATLTEYDAASNITRRTVRNNFTIGAPNSGDVQLDTTALFDEGSFNYESRQRLTAGADGGSDPLTRRKFDWAGNVIEERMLGDSTVADRVVITGYDSANRIETISDSEGGLTTYVRDDRGNIIDQIVRLDSRDSATTTMEYDALSRPTKITDPEDELGARHFRVFRYDSRGNVLRQTHSSSGGVARVTNVAQYDLAGRQVESSTLANAAGFSDPITSTDPAVDRVVDREFDADGRLRFEISYNNNSATELETQTTYDALGRVDVVTDPAGVTTDPNYALNGRLASRVVNDKLSARTFNFGYDGHDRLTSQTAVGTPNLVTSFEYDGLDRRIRTTDPKGTIDVTGFDLTGRQNRLLENETGGALERETLFTYNRLNQLITQTAKNKTAAGGTLPDQFTRYRYDTLGRTLRVFYPDSSDVNFEAAICSDCVRMVYDDAGRLTNRIDQRGWDMIHQYDQRGLLLSRAVSNAQINRKDEFDFDPVGRMTLAQRGTSTVADAFAKSTMAYTALSYLDFEQQTIAQGASRTVDYGYDQLGNRLSMVYPGGTTLSFAPTVLNQVDSIGFGAQSITYDYFNDGPLPQNRRTTTGAGSAAYNVTWGFDSQRRVSQVGNAVSFGASTVPVATHVLTRDNNGNPLTQTASGQAPFSADDRVYTVDALDRVTGADYDDFPVTQATLFDLLGNRQSHTDRVGDVISYGSVNAANEYATIDSETLVYDAVGNLATDEAGRSYFYDEHNRLTEVRDANDVVLAGYSYDALGRRVRSVVGSTVSRIYYDGRRELEERDASDVRVRYHLNGEQFIDERVATFEDSSSAYRYYLLGDQFSVIGTGNPGGNSFQRVSYGADGSFVCPVEPVCHDCDHAPTCDGDVDGDGQVNDSDLGLVIGSFNQSLGDPMYDACADFDCDGFVGDEELGLVINLFGQPCPACLPAVASGSFVLHGRPVDVLPDGKVLIYLRARYYDPEHGRWLQRDPSGYVDGGNLYEAFLSNAATHTDPSGEDVWIDADPVASTDSRGRPIWVVTYTRNRNRLDLGTIGALTQLASGNWNNPDFAESETLVQVYPRSPRRNIWNVIASEQQRLADDFTAAADEQAYTEAIIVAASTPIALVTAGGSQAVATSVLGRVGVTSTTGAGRIAIGASGGALSGGLSLGGGTAAAVPLGVADLSDVSPNAQAGALGGAIAGAGLSSVASLVRGTPATPAWEANFAKGAKLEQTAARYLYKQGYEIVETQYLRGAVQRGLDFAAFRRTPKGVDLVLVEVKATAGLVSPARFTSLGLGRGGPSVYTDNIAVANSNILAAAGSNNALFTQLSNQLNSAPIILVGPAGFRVSPQTIARIQQQTGRSVQIVTIP